MHNQDMYNQNTAPPFTAEDWYPRFEELGCNPSMLLGHMHALRITFAHINKLKETATSFEELKSELLKFEEQQKAFIEDVNLKWSPENHEKYGLPQAW